MSGSSLSDGATQLHSNALVWDMTLPLDWICGSDDAHMRSLHRMQKAGHSFVSCTVGHDMVDLEGSFRHIGAMRRRVEAEGFQFCMSVADIRAAKANGVLGVGFHFQGTNPFAGDVNTVAPFYDLGIRHALLAYNQKNAVGDGCHERTDGGLSRFGIALIHEMNRVGMIVDCSHCGYTTTMEAMEVSQSPCMFSHANVKAIRDHPRCIGDDQIDACAKQGGVIGITGVGIYIGDNEATTEHLLRQIDYIAERTAPKHVGLAFDFVSDVPQFMSFLRANLKIYPDESYDVPEMVFAQPEQMPEITEGLLKRGYSEDDILGILGENFARFCDGVWK